MANIGPPPPYAPGSGEISPQLQPGVNLVRYGEHGMVPVIVESQMGIDPATVVCKTCLHEIVTRVDRVATMRTHAMTLILCLLGCWCCACVPYFMNTCRSSQHYCPKCNAYIGIYKS